jgi:hypothetical protein
LGPVTDPEQKWQKGKVANYYIAPKQHKLRKKTILIGKNYVFGVKIKKKSLDRN